MIILAIGIIGRMVECPGREFGVKGAVVFIAPANLPIGNPPPYFQWNYHLVNSG